MKVMAALVQKQFNIAYWWCERYSTYRDRMLIINSWYNGNLTVLGGALTSSLIENTVKSILPITIDSELPTN